MKDLHLLPYEVDRIDKFESMISDEIERQLSKRKQSTSPLKVFLNRALYQELFLLLHRREEKYVFFEASVCRLRVEPSDDVSFLTLVEEQGSVCSVVEALPPRKEILVKHLGSTRESYMPTAMRHELPERCSGGDELSEVLKRKQKSVRW